MEKGKQEDGRACSVVESFSSWGERAEKVEYKFVDRTVSFNDKR